MDMQYTIDSLIFAKRALHNEDIGNAIRHIDDALWYLYDAMDRIGEVREELELEED